MTGGHSQPKLLLKLVLVGWACCLSQLAAGSGRAEDIDLPGPKAIPEVLVYTDAAVDAPEPAAAVIVDKSRQRIKLYQYDGNWRMVGKWPCSTGRRIGPKAVEGDQRTPEGVYFVTRNVDQRYLTATYGARALPLDYPNWLDAHLARSGSAIWIHGTNKPLQERDSNGCVVLENSAVDQLAGSIRLNRTPVIIVDRLRLQAASDARKLARKFLTFVDQWHDALMHGSFEEFHRWYGNQVGPSMQWWQKWCRQRHRAGADAAYSSQIGQRSIYRYGGYYVLLFDHYLKTASRSQWVGRRKLFLSLEDDRVKILGDTYQTAPCRRQDPLLYAWQRLWKAVQDNNELAVKEKSRHDS
jgi:L,D-transpeptidase catalytic domain